MRHIILWVSVLMLGGCAGSFSCTFETDDEAMERIFEQIELKGYRDETEIDE